MIDVVSLNTPTAPVTAQQLRDWLRLNDTSEDSILTELIASALDVWEQRTNCPIIHTQFRQYVQRWPSEIVLGRGAFVSCAGLWYVDVNGAAQTFSAWAMATSTPVRVVLRSMPPTPLVLQQPVGYVDFTAGLAANAAAAPKQALVAIKQLAAHWYQNREAYASDSLKAIPQGFDEIATRFKLGLSGRWGQ